MKWVFAKTTTCVVCLDKGDPIEVVRTEDSTDHLRRVFVRKNTKYIQLMQQLRALFSDFRVPKQDHLIQTCMKDTIEGTYGVWRTGLR